MTTIRNLTNKVTRLECQRKAHIHFELVEEHWPADNHFAECDFALKRNGQVLFRFPRKLSIAEWETKYSQSHP